MPRAVAFYEAVLGQELTKPPGDKVQHEKFPIGPHGLIAMGTDPDGNVFGLHSIT